VENHEPFQDTVPKRSAEKEKTLGKKNQGKKEARLAGKRIYLQKTFNQPKKGSREIAREGATSVF